MQRIVFVTTNDYAPWGGSEVLWSQVAKSFRGKGADVGVSVKNWCPTPKHIIELANMGCDIHFRNTESFGEWLESQFPELVLFSMGNSVDGFDLIHECRVKGIKYALLIQLVSEYFWLHEDEITKWIDLYMGAQKCFFVSKKNKRLVEKMTGVEIHNSAIVPNPFQVQYNEPFKWPIQSNGYKLACVASLQSLHKGQDILMEVLRSEKWKRRPLSVNLFGTGPHKALLSRLKNLWSLDQIQIIGFTEDVSDVWNHHHALILPSRMEGMSLAVIEAMLKGRVVLTTDVGANTELIEDNVSGFIAKAPTADLLEEAMERAWQRRLEWESIGNVAYSRARLYLPENPASIMETSLRELGDRKS